MCEEVRLLRRIVATSSGYEGHIYAGTDGAGTAFDANQF